MECPACRKRSHRNPSRPRPNAPTAMPGGFYKWTTLAASLAAAGIAGWHVASTRNGPPLVAPAECSESLGAGGTLVSFVGAGEGRDRALTMIGDLEATDALLDDEKEGGIGADFGGDADDSEHEVEDGDGSESIEHRRAPVTAYIRIHGHDAFDFTTDEWDGEEVVGRVKSRSGTGSGSGEGTALEPSGGSSLGPSTGASDEVTGRPTAACLDNTLCLYASLASDGPLPAWPAAGTPFRLARDAFREGKFPQAARGFLDAAGQLPPRFSAAETAADLAFVCRSAALAASASPQGTLDDVTHQGDHPCADHFSAWVDRPVDPDAPRIMHVRDPDPVSPILATSDQPAPSPQTPTHRD